MKEEKGVCVGKHVLLLWLWLCLWDVLCLGLSSDYVMLCVIWHVFDQVRGVQK